MIIGAWQSGHWRLQSCQNSSGWPSQKKCRLENCVRACVSSSGAKARENVVGKKLNIFLCFQFLTVCFLAGNLSLSFHIIFLWFIANKSRQNGSKANKEEPWVKNAIKAKPGNA